MTTPEHPRLRWYQPLTWAVGLGCAWFGVREAHHAKADAPIWLVTRWAVAAALVHDLVLAPAVGLVAFALGRLVRPVWRTPVLIGTALTGLVALYAYPLVRAYGRRADNPSTLPHNYAHGLLVVVACIWGTVAVVGVAAARRHRRRPPLEAR